MPDQPTPDSQEPRPAALRAVAPIPPDLGTALTPAAERAWLDDPAEQATMSLLGLLSRLAGDLRITEPGGAFRARIALAEHAIRIAAAVDPLGALRDLDRAETSAWLTDPTLYRKALYDGGPTEVRRLMRALQPAQRLYLDVAEYRATQTRKQAEQDAEAAAATSAAEAEAARSAREGDRG